MRVHKHLVLAVAEILVEVFDGGNYADKVLDRHLKNNKKWGARDRRFVAESVYEVVRWWRYLWWLKGADPSTDRESLLELWALWWSELKNGERPPWLPPAPTRSLNRTDLPRAIRQSIPDWLDSLGASELGDRWDSIVQELNEPADVYLRANTLVTTPEKLARELGQLGIEVEALGPELPHSFRLAERKNVFVTQAFKKGEFEVQDAASQMVAPLLEVEPGHRVIDACAGAGGKTLHLAALMENRGKIISMDVHNWKLNELKRRAKRARVQNVETRLIDSGKVIKRLKNSCDRLLLDVPCSGLGVLKRNPDTKWKLTEEDVVRLRRLQVELLNDYGQLLKKGGKMVYATCSILPSEDEAQVEGFLSVNPNWKLEEMKRLDPDQTGFDGFFAARLRRD